jgi:Cu2+-exporting ATPase
VSETCSFCGLPTPDPPVTGDGTEADGAFCCWGCLEVARTLDARDERGEPGADADTHARERLETGADPEEDPDGESAFVAVEGMHCTTCEAFLEARTTDCEGVAAASASYPTGTMRVVYDPDATDPERIAEAATGTGYDARAGADPGVDRDEGTGAGATGRLLVGGFFGMMTMCWYVLLLYPAYLGLPPETRLIDLQGTAGTYLLWNVWLMATVVVGYTGAPLLRGAYVSLRTGRPNMDLLVGIAVSAAYLYSVGALLLGGTEVYFDVAIVVVLAVGIGDRYADRMRRRAAGRLTDLTEERVAEARRRAGTDGDTERVAADDLEPGDEVVVRAGERVPADGTVAEGTGAADESLVTGEALPVQKAPGDEAVGGALLTDGGVVVTVGPGATNTLDRLADLLWEVRSRRPGVQRLADRAAAVFVPLVLVLSAATVAWHLLGGDVGDALLAGLAVLVVSCPCALGLATPLAVAAGIRAALADGIVATDGAVFETAPEIETVAFDKTGTLTTGRMRVLDVEGGADVRRRAAAVERFADHPVAAAVVEAAEDGSAAATDFEEHPGRGASAVVDGDRVLVGRRALFEERGLTVPDRLVERHDAARAAGRVPVLVGWDGRARGLLVAGDEPREGWEDVVADLAADREVVVITGDGEAAAERFREHPGIDRVFAGVPPEAKAGIVERLQADGPVAMVGDGSNDAPALATADLGIALERGTRLAADAADAVVTTDDPGAVPRLFDVIGGTNRRIRENLAWAFCYNAVAVPLAVAGLLNPAFAAVAMAASSVLVVANSARSL